MTFESMGCEIVVGGATDAELARVHALFEERDAVFSRFRPGSEPTRSTTAAAPGSCRRSLPGWSRRRFARGTGRAASSTLR